MKLGATHKFLIMRKIYKNIRRTFPIGKAINDICIIRNNNWQPKLSATFVRGEYAPYIFNRGRRCSRRRASAGVVIGACVKCDRLWATIAGTMGCYQYATPQVDTPLAAPTMSLSFPFARPRLLGTEDPTGLPRRNMLARTSDTLGLAVCRAVPITPRRIPSACYLSPGTCAGDIM